jgi:protein TonB
VYPKLARQARIQGTVVLSAVIGESGRIEQLRLIEGHPLLVVAAMDAVKRWRYRPAMFGGVPVAVRTTISVTFRFGPQPDRSAVWV